MNQKIQKTMGLGFVSLVLAGCLATRQEVREGVARPTAEQQARLNTESRYTDLEKQNQNLLNRIETLENSISTLSRDKSGLVQNQELDKKALQDRLKIYEEAITKLESQYLLLSQKYEVLQADVTAAASTKAKESNVSTGGGTKKGNYQLAEDEFSKKNWKLAIVSYEKYREMNPTGKFYADATYKIGVSFQELGMNAEAKTFYTEVVDKFPKSEVAKNAKSKMKNIK